MLKPKWIVTLLALNFYAPLIFAQCTIGDQWFLPAENKIASSKQIDAILPARGIIILGEHHVNTAHHIWQLEVIKSLFKKQKALAIGLEMQPRANQKVLDQWINKTLNKDEFLKLSKWREYWGSNFEDYLPILEFARDNAIPLVALNISHELLQGIETVGWEQIPQDHREGVGEPAKPGKGYLKKLASSFAKHKPANEKLDKEAFLRFYQQQLLWDRAMAEKLSETITQKKFQLVVGLMGSWHIIDKEGVPYQLQDLGHQQVTTLVPWDPNIPCDSVTPSFADAIYGMAKH